MQRGMKRKSRGHSCRGQKYPALPVWAHGKKDRQGEKRYKGIFTIDLPRNVSATPLAECFSHMGCTPPQVRLVWSGSLVARYQRLIQANTLVDGFAG
jgi:hypothetical protein